MAGALHAAHTAGVLHLDVKPHNIDVYKRQLYRGSITLPEALDVAGRP